MLKIIVSGLKLIIRNGRNRTYPYQHKLIQRILHCFANFWRGSKFRAKDDIPEAAGNSEAVLIVHEVVLKVVLFQFSPVRGKRLMVKEVVCEVVTYVPKYTTAENSSRSVPIPEEDGMCEFPEWYC
jgi:hypothetical protein